MTTLTFPNSPYELHQPFGNLPETSLEAIEKLIDGPQRRRLSFQTLLGVTGSGKMFMMANVIARTGRPRS